MSIALNNVYNNYLTTYQPKTLTRHDAHKKSELRGVYNSIVKLNKEAPWYLPTTSKETQNYAVDLKENARELHNTLADLGGLEEDGLLNKKSAFSSNENIATATYIGDETGASPKFELEVTSLASPQENLGKFLDDGASALPPDTYSFDVSINDMNYEFQFAVAPGETNKDVQSRLMRLVNNSNIGIHADMIESEGRTALRLTSDSSGLPYGKSEIFQITDDHTSKSSGTVDYFGLDYTSQAATNASFILNGEPSTATSNQFTIGKQFEVQLKGITGEDESVTIGLKEDIDSFADNVSQLVGGYNAFMKAASNYLSSQSKSSNLVQEMKGIAGLYHNSMEAMGLNMAEDGTLEVDSALLRESAMQSEDISETFSYLKDFSAALMRKSNQISLNPMDYVDRKIVAYKNPGHNYVSPYTTSAYSGMMFNSYC
ncbi:MAG: flagellar capping protein [Lachnospiraceae bacterium]|nr:flagellar capping protein [Lachnospiraceae bacterium]